MTSVILTVWGAVLLVTSYKAFSLIARAQSEGDPYLSITAGAFGMVTFVGGVGMLAVAWF